MADFGRNASDYASHRAGFPDALWPRLRALGIGLPDQHVLDIGTGTGAIARALHSAGCRVEAVDKDAAMIAAANRLEPGIAFRLGTAESTGAADESFDVVTAGQCWHWFDRKRAASEVLRVLAPGGALCIAHFDFLRGHPVVDSSWNVIEPHRDRPLPPESVLGTNALYGEWLSDLGAFESLETFSFDVDALYSRDAWRGRMRASVWVGATLDADRIARIDRELEAMLRTFEEPLRVPHRVFCVIARKPQS